MQTKLGILAFVTALISIVYELLLAQILASTLGNTNLRYGMTVGIYIASLGIGALICEKKKLEFRHLVSIELSLSCLGLLSPALFIMFDHLVRNYFPGTEDVFTAFQTFLSYGFTHSIIVIIGVLSGMELPLLMAKAKDKTSGRKILGIDYLGTVCGAVMFPLLFLPWLGVFGTALCVAGLNVLVLGYLILMTDIKVTRWQKFSSGIVFANLVFVAINLQGYQSYFIESWYLR